MFSAQIKSWFEARLRGAISHSVRDLSFKVEMGKITSLHLSTYFQEELNIKSTELSLIDQKCVTVCVTEHDGFEPHVHSFFIIIIIASFVQSSGSFNPGFPSFIFMSFPIFISFLSFPLSCPHSSCFLPPLSSFFHSFNLSFPWFISLIFIFFHFLLHFFFITFSFYFSPFFTFLSYFLILSFLVCSLFFLASFLPLLIAFSCLSCLPFFFSSLSLCAFYSLFFNLFILVPFSCPFYFFLVPSLSFLFAFPFYLFFPFYASNSFYYFFPFSFSPSFLVSFALPPFSLILLSFQSFSLPCSLVSLSFRCYIIKLDLFLKVSWCISTLLCYRLQSHINYYDGVTLCITTHCVLLYHCVHCADEGWLRLFRELIRLSWWSPGSALLRRSGWRSDVTRVVSLYLLLLGAD